MKAALERSRVFVRIGDVASWRRDGAGRQMTSRSLLKRIKLQEEPRDHLIQLGDEAHDLFSTDASDAAAQWRGGSFGQRGQGEPGSFRLSGSQIKCE